LAKDRSWIVKKKRVMFICVHNSFRSQIAEHGLTKSVTGSLKRQSAGLEPGLLDPLAIKAKLEAWCAEVCPLETRAG